MSKLTLLILLFISIPCKVISQNLKSEQAILLNLKQQWGNPPSIQSWNSSSSPCDWPEIRCSKNKVTRILLCDKNITGEIPSSICDLKNLNHIDLSWNYIPGQFPKVLYNCSKLEFLDLSGNSFVGPIPDDVDRIPTLLYLNLAANNFSRDIPASIGRLPNLKTLYLYQNEFNGTFPKEIGNLSNLEGLGMAYNEKFVPATIPVEFGQLKKLEFMWIMDSNLIGHIPESFGNLSSLEHLDLNSNKLEGTIKSIGNCSSLRRVFLYNNNFSGAVPLGLWTALNLSELELSGNSFSGKLPSRIGRSLSLLEISNNKFSGQIPVGISTWTSLFYFKASNNRFSGKIPLELTRLWSLLILLLDGNQLSGGLPSEIVSWSSLHTLNLSRNGLSGQIPTAIQYWPNLLHLDLSENQFTGEIPPRIGHLTLLSVNFSSNKLSGKVPQEFDDLAYKNSFLNNPNLCTDGSILNLPSCSMKFRDSNKLSSKYLAMILVLAITVSLVSFSLTLFMVRVCNRKKPIRNLATCQLIPFQKLDFTEANILSSLTENNLIGSGGSGKVYRVAISSSGEYVGVKRIWNNKKLDHNLEKQFIAEVQILGKIRHSNIVKLLCCISIEDSKLLVYEYMENQSLDKWLHGKKRSILDSGLADHAVLDWPTRLQIAIGAAQGLCYMHHDYSPPIIHRDVKSSNILLDSEFKARIADFGLAKMLPKQGEPHTMSAIAGSFGYLAPEYAYTSKANEKIDVYSFGVVLLELATGREPTRGDEHTNLAQWAWQHYGEELKSIVDALDDEIKEPCYLEEMTTLFKLGLFCTSTLPSTRPSMKEVLQILHRCGRPPES